MAIGVLFELEGFGKEQYDAITDQMTDGRGLKSPSDWPVEGLLAHISGPTDTGWRVVDVWESEQAFQSFGEQLMPLAKEQGLELQPQIFQIYNFVAA